MNILTKEIFKPINKNFERRRVIVNYPNLIWGADLVDMSQFKNKNKGVTFLLNVVDIYSRYAWSIPIKTKSKEDVLNAFKSIVEEVDATPDKLWVDEGVEFYNKSFKEFCKDNDILMYSTHSGLKSVFVERFNRTMKEYLTIDMTEKSTTYYLPILKEFLDEYNTTKRRATKETPENLYFKNGESQEKQPVKENLPLPKFKVGDYVRLSKAKGIFEKGYTSRYTYEVFKVESVDDADYPYLYQLTDLMDEKIEGKAYEKEMIKTEVPFFKVIDKVVKRKTENGKKYVMVSYVGYPSKFDEWITETNLKKQKK